MMADAKAPHILVVGGGYVGMHTALRLQRKLRRGEATVTVVAAQPNMTYQPFLAEAAAGSIEPRLVVVPLRRVLRRCRVLNGEVSAVHHQRRVATVVLSSGQQIQLPYDVLVEAADRVLPELSRSLADDTVQRLRERGMDVRLETRVESMVDGRVVLSDGDTFDADTVVWTTWVKAHPLAVRSGLPVDHKGRVAEVYGVKLRGRPAWYLHRAHHLTRVSTLEHKRIIYAVGTGAMSRTRLPHLAARREAPAAPWPRWGDLRVVLAPLALRLPHLTRQLSAAHMTLFLWTRGRLASRWFGAAVLVLETVGRRTGTPRAAPIVYLPDGQNLVVIPANGGAHRPPAWWLNLQAAGRGVAVLGRERRQIRPLEAAGAERERLWQRFAAISPVEHYQRRTDRHIPVVVLAPAADHPSPPPSPVHDPITPDQSPLEARPCQLSS